MTRELEPLCTCPKRTAPPPLPTEIPKEITVEKDEKKALMKAWILDRYASSTFNTCEHQPLPTMTGEPLCLFIDDTVKPTAVHVLSPALIHQRKEAKEQIDRDIRLGVIEPVKVNTPVMLCARCVWVTKND